MYCRLGFNVCKNPMVLVVVLRSQYHGLKSVFFDWSLPRQAGFQQAQAHYAALSKRLKYTVTMSEAMALEMGYRSMQEKKFDQAIEAMSWATRTYPASPNPWDSLCEVLSNANQVAEAKTQCEKAVRVAEQNNDPLLPEYKASLARVIELLKKQGQ